jgi:hypothetical protein
VVSTQSTTRYMKEVFFFFFFFGVDNLIVGYLVTVTRILGTHHHFSSTNFRPISSRATP